MRKEYDIENLNPRSNPYVKKKNMLVKVLSNGKIEMIAFKDIVAHEEAIIEDNMFFGVKNNYSMKEISKYQKEAKLELRALRRTIRENPDIVLKIDPVTERYVPVKDN